MKIVSWKTQSTQSQSQFQTYFIVLPHWKQAILSIIKTPSTRSLVGFSFFPFSAISPKFRTKGTFDLNSLRALMISSITVLWFHRCMHARPSFWEYVYSPGNGVQHNPFLKATPTNESSLRSSVKYGRVFVLLFYDNQAPTCKLSFAARVEVPGTYPRTGCYGTKGPGFTFQTDEGILRNATLGSPSCFHSAYLPLYDYFR